MDNLMEKFCAGSVTIFFVSSDVETASAFSIRKYRRLRIKLDFSYALTMYIFPTILSLKIFIFFSVDSGNLGVFVLSGSAVHAVPLRVTDRKKIFSTAIKLKMPAQSTAGMNKRI
jgi:hypothetical protein